MFLYQCLKPKHADKLCSPILICSQFPIPLDSEMVRNEDSSLNPPADFCVGFCVSAPPPLPIHLKQCETVTFCQRLCSLNCKFVFLEGGRGFGVYYVSAIRWILNGVAQSLLL